MNLQEGSINRSNRRAAETFKTQRRFPGPDANQPISFTLGLPFIGIKITK
jgi:hypothetical protein